MAKMRGFVIPKRRVILFFVVLALVIASGIWYSVDSFRRAESGAGAFDMLRQPRSSASRSSRFSVRVYGWVELSRSFIIGG